MPHFDITTCRSCTYTLLQLLLLFYFSSSGTHRDLHSFPTRRSSDLNGVMFVATPGNQVLAIDAKTGNLLWRYRRDRKSTRLNSSHQIISYAVFCLKKKKNFRSRGY